VLALFFYETGRARGPYREFIKSLKVENYNIKGEQQETGWVGESGFKKGAGEEAPKQKESPR
jgi:hypothetical protein